MKIKFHIGKTWGKNNKEVGLGIKTTKKTNLFIHIRLFVWMVSIGFIKKPKYTEEELEDMEAHAYDLALSAMIKKFSEDELEVHDMTGYWIDKLGLSGWTITTEAIDKKSVIYADDVPESDQYFVGVEIDREKMMACIYHDRPLNDDYVVHELLHVKYSDWSEDQVNAETERLINQNKDE